MQNELLLYNVKIKNLEKVFKELLNIDIDAKEFILSIPKSIEYQMKHFKLSRHKVKRLRSMLFQIYSYDKTLYPGFKRVNLCTTQDYAVNEIGIVYNIRNRLVAKTHIDDKGYLRTNLTYIYNGVKRDYIRVHRLVLMTFKPIPNPDEMQVNHIDGNKNNNALWNLEWLNSKDHARHTFRLSLNPSFKLSYEDKEEIKKLYQLGYKAITIAKQFNVTTTTIYNIINNKY